MIKEVIHGPLFTSVDQNHVQALDEALVTIDDSGYIDQVLTIKDGDFQAVLQDADKKGILTELSSGDYLLPGFIDLHEHAPQWPQAGLALDRPLADWLNVYTFPLEAKYTDIDFARRVYHNLVHEFLAQGTTTVLMFGTIDLGPNLELVDQCRCQGLRAFVGQVVMDNPDQTPEYYRNASAKGALSATEQFIQRVQDGDDLVKPAITPRFVPSCTDEALAGLGRLAAKYNLLIQSHLSESNWEHQYAIDRFGQHDAEVLTHFGLLNDRSVMAHATQLTYNDQKLVKQQGAAIAHCPISNIYFGNGVLPVKKLLAQGIKVGLGCDLSGGYSPSLYHNIRAAIKSSQMLTDGVDSRLAAKQRGVANSRISASTAFYLATVGGAQALHINSGQIAPGKLADLQVVSAKPALIPLSPQDVFERLMYQTERENVEAVWVNGKCCYHSAGY